MLTAGWHTILLTLASAGFIGAGASLAVVRTRGLREGERDTGMLGVGALLFTFGALCAAVGSGLVAVLACGSVMVWLGYVAAAQRLGLFEIETGWLEHTCAEEPRQRT